MSLWTRPRGRGEEWGSVAPRTRAAGWWPEDGAFRGCDGTPAWRPPQTRTPGRRQGTFSWPLGWGKGQRGPTAPATDKAAVRTAAWSYGVADEAAWGREEKAAGRNGRGPSDGRRGRSAVRHK